MDIIRRRVVKTLGLLPAWLTLQSSKSLIAEQAQPGSIQQTRPVDVIRLFNTLELTHKLKLGTYASKDNLIAWPVTGKFLTSPHGDSHGMRGTYQALNLNSREIIPGWIFELTPSTNGEAYLITMIASARSVAGGVNLSGGEPKQMFASDESGLIHEGMLSPLKALPTSVAPVSSIFPDLLPLGARQDRTLRARVSYIVRNVALQTIQQSGCVFCAPKCAAPNICCCAGTCGDFGQCICYNCGCQGCRWCCYPYCSVCSFCGTLCSCC